MSIVIKVDAHRTPSRTSDDASDDMHFQMVVRTGLWGRVVTPQQPEARKELSQKGHFVPSYLMERVREEEMKKQTENGKKKGDISCIHT